MSASELLPDNCERGEWRAVAWSLGTLLCVFGAGWVYTARGNAGDFSWPVAVSYGIGLAWLVRALFGCWRGSTERIDKATLDTLRDRWFWSVAARCSYAALMVCDGLFLLDAWPDKPALFFAFAAISALFSLRIAIPSAAVAAYCLL